MSDIWKDPNVKAALKDGRQPEDIAILDCPQCGEAGYYNQGTWFVCRFCDQSFYCCSEDEEAPAAALCVWLNDVRTLADNVDAGNEP